MKGGYWVAALNTALSPVAQFWVSTHFKELCKNTSQFSISILIISDLSEITFTRLLPAVRQKNENSELVKYRDCVEKRVACIPFALNRSIENN